jgi:hypothetical protein
MYILKITVNDLLKKDLLVAAPNPLRDPKEWDGFIDLRMEERTEETAVAKAIEMAAKYRLEYWELNQVVPVVGCHF